MKRAFICVLALSMILSLIACKNNDNDSIEELLKKEKTIEDGETEEHGVKIPETTPVNVTEVVVEPQSKLSMGISFNLPEGWTYEITYSDDEPTSCTGTLVRPKSVGVDGEIIIEYTKGFSVCGTGLRTEKILFNGYEASKGFYDDNPLWSYIALKGDYKDCVIINSADSWYDDYADEINLILDSIQFKFFE